MSINNFTFFAAIDDLVRKSMKEFETRLLPVVIQACEETGVPIRQVPIEGYYHETTKLRDYFIHLSALQDNFTETVTDAVRKLHDIYSRPVFGLAPGKWTVLNQGEGVISHPDGRIQKSIISPMYDTLGLATRKVMAEQGPDALGIDAIMDATEGFETGVHLVGFSVMVDRTYKREQNKPMYNPVATTMGAETTVLSRFKPVTLGGGLISYVSEEVEQKGMEIVAAYNELFRAHPEGQGLQLPTEKWVIFRKADDMNFDKIPGRCVSIAVDSTQIPEIHYHWAVVRGDEIGDYEGLRVLEFRSDELVTTEKFRQIIKASPNGKPTLEARNQHAYLKP